MPDLNIFLLQCRASYLRRLSMLLTTEHSFKSCWREALRMPTLQGSDEGVWQHFEKLTT